MKYLLFASVFLSSCMQTSAPEDPLIKKAQAVATSDLDQTVRNLTKYLLDNSKNYPINATNYYHGKNAEEIMKTLEIVEKIDVESINTTLVFYRYSIGKDIVRKADWFIKVDGKWFESRRYYSEYYDDPFKDGKPEEAKRILQKETSWEEGNKSLWWEQ